MRMSNYKEHDTKQARYFTQLLDDMEKAQQDDIKLYTRGHLNHNKLYKPALSVSQGFWASAKRSAPAEPGRQSVRKKNVGKMKDVLCDFTLNTALIPDGPRATPSFKELYTHTRLPKILPQAQISFPVSSLEAYRRELDTSDQYSKTQEIDPLELKVLRYKIPKNSRQCLNMTKAKDEYRFIRSYLAGVTKMDQFKSFLHFEKDVLVKQDLQDNDFTGAKAAECHEKKLQQELQKIHDSNQPSIRLQIFGDVFEDICNGSFIFGDILKEVKNEYELYMATLLDSQPISFYEELLVQAKGLEKGPVEPSDLEEAKQDVKKLVQEVKAALERNEQLRNELEIVLKKPSDHRESDALSKNLGQSADKEKQLTFSERVEEKRCEVLLKWEKIHALKQEIKSTLTHTRISNITEQSLKSIEDLESIITNTFSKHKVSQEDQKKIWNLLDTSLTPENGAVEQWP
ncbi:uncharacterized protein C6orf118 homolog isoform X2 [Ornithorhynchus anatinus]|uniref:uncharacterized protein C6orf118 homolog isoform X2 n=1 Tax=Ornithorhynchus anatinus TaxID=9258 RepID=UPI0010A86614|nr:uncharacterized protein C6orf118 homolog isoform X2 [Ornithorhynchus anatinus]